MTAVVITSEVVESRRNTICKFRGILRPPLLRFAQNDERLSARHFFTISAFSIMAMPPRSASLPFRVMFLPQYSAS